MARDPDTFRVSPSLSGMPQLQATPVQSAVPEQMQRAGQALQGAGQQAAAIYTDVLREQNATRVTEALTQLTEKRNQYTHDPENGWASLTGKNALERPDGKALDEEYGGLLDNDVETLSMNLGNDAQRKMFRERAQAMSLDFRQRIGTHVAEQSRNYQLETMGGMVDLGQRQLSLATSPQELAEAQAIISNGAQKIFELKGTAPEARDKVLRDLMTPGHLAQLNRRMETDDIDGAEAYFNEHREMMTEDAVTKVEGALIEQRTIKDAYDIGEAVAGAAIQQNETSAPQMIGMPVVGAYRQTGSFGEKRPGHRHGGIDWAMPKGTPVRAGAGGVARVKSDPNGYGTYVDLKLDDGTTLRMAHLDGADVQDGQRVNKGDVIGRSGSSGRSTGPHLHYEVIGPDGAKRDPVEFHQGRPTARAEGATTRSWSSIVEDITSRGLPPKTEKLALERARLVYTAREESRKQNEDDLLSAAYAEVDRNGSLSSATLSRLTGSGLGTSIPSLRSFEQATQKRASGGTMAEDDALEAYGRTKLAIAQGEITSMDHLLRVKPYVTDSMFKQLTDDFSNNPQDARVRTQKAVRLVDAEIQGSGLFRDKDGKITPETRKEYQRFVGAVVNTLEGRRLAGQPQSYEEDRKIVLGLLAQDTVNGEKMRNYDIRQLYDTIPPRARLVATRMLEGQNKPATIANVVSTWQSMSDAGRARYTGNGR